MTEGGSESCAWSDAMEAATEVPKEDAIPAMGPPTALRPRSITTAS